MKVSTCFFSLLLISNFLLAKSPLLGPRLTFILAARQAGLAERFHLPSFDRIPVTLTFSAAPAADELSLIENAGIDYQRIRGEILGSSRVKVGFLDGRSFNSEVVPSQINLVEIETTWQPHHAYPLVVSRPQIEAEQVWQLASPPNAGKGILIADLDTGINHFHPMFFFADGDTFTWTDVNQNSQFDPGIDGVDYDQSGSISPAEVLQLIEVSTGGALTNPPGYNPSLDWIYTDSNLNSQRDYGPQAGFTESDPAYGEPIFISLDQNGNDLLDVTEPVVMLKTSKVRKVYQSDGVIRERGVDMIHNEGDYYNHGTPVGGILLGGIPGVHRMAGIAPQAELLMGVNVYVPDPPFIHTMEFLAPWAAGEGADIILYEDGEWIWQYMDGSSALETMIDDFSVQGIMQVVPAGNLSGGQMHTSDSLAAMDSLETQIDIAFPYGQTKLWGNFLWLGDSAALRFKLKLPGGSWVSLPGDGSFISTGNYQLYSNYSRSSRGTNRFDFAILITSGSLSGSYVFRVINTANQPVEYHAYEVDNLSSWYGYSQWLDDNNEHTVTWPATADQAFTVAAYDPRSPVQARNAFSGRGARIDGMRLVDIAAPGSVVYSATRSGPSIGAFSSFGGTSAAGPHVAAACALLFQLLGQNEVALVKDAIKQSANTDNIIATFPNHEWGYGRIRAFQAAMHLYTPIEPPVSPLPNDFQVQVYPNPFNSSTQIQFRVPVSGSGEITIYNLPGQMVYHHSFQGTSAEEINVFWRAEEQSSGIYLLAVEINGRIRAVRKLVLVK
ncbi:MAG: hypothetical protein Kow0042_15660 [Calditrichia bacterium]